MRTRTAIITVLAALLVLAGCAAQKSASGTDYGNPSNGVLLRLHQAAGTINKYEVTSKSEQVMEAMGQVMESTADGKIVLTHNTVEVAGGNITHEFVFNTYDFTTFSDMQGETKGDAKAILEIPFVVKSNDTGTSTEIVTKDFPAYEGGAPAELQFLGVIFECPELRVKAGDTWTGKQYYDLMKGDVGMQIESDNNYTLTGFEERMGYQCAVISVKSTSKTTGAIEQQGMIIGLEAEGVNEGTVYFAYNEGLIIEGISNGTMDMVGTIASMGMSIPIDVKETGSFKLIQE